MGKEEYPENLPLADTAVLSPRVFPHIGIAVDGKIVFVFPNKTPVVDIERMAKHLGGEIYVVKVKLSFEITTENYYYDHSPLISRTSL